MNSAASEVNEPAPVHALALPASSSVARRLFRIIFGSYFVFTLLVTVIQLGAQYRLTEHRVNAEIQSMRQTFGPGIADAMWHFQDDVLRGILVGMNALPVVVGVKVLDPNGNLVRAMGTVIDPGGQRVRVDADGHASSAPPQSGLLAQTFGQEFPIVYTDENGRQRNIGRWFVYSDRSVIVQQVQYEFLLIFLSAILKATALWFIFLYVVQRWLGRPLTQLSDFVRKVDIDNLGAQPFVVQGKGRDELHFLADSLNYAASRLRQSVQHNAQLYLELEQDQRRLRELNDTLEHRVAERTADLQSANRQLAELSLTDALTGIANRRRFDELLESEWSRAMRSGQPLALAMIDVDQFKQYNDHYGHHGGDLCLRAVARSLGEAVRRGGDLVARYGGEEFVVVAPATDGAHALTMGRTLCQAVLALGMPHAQSEIGCVSVSIGVASMVPAKGESAQLLLQRADEALYRAKVEGRNRVLGDILQTDVSRVEPHALVELLWQDSFACGNAHIDDQHRALFQLSNELLARVLAGDNGLQTEDLIERLINDVQQHFSDEEAVMRKAGFTALGAHAAEHEKLLGRGRELQRALLAGSLATGDLFQFLAVEVIKQHILGADRDCRSLVAGLG